MGKFKHENTNEDDWYYPDNEALKFTVIMKLNCDNVLIKTPSGNP